MLGLSASSAAAQNVSNVVSAPNPLESSTAPNTVELQTVANRYNAYIPDSGATASDNSPVAQLLVVPSDLNLIFAQTQVRGELKPPAAPPYGATGPKQMFSIAVEQGCPLLDSGVPLEDVMQQLEITPGTSAERILFKHLGRTPPQPAPSASTDPARHLEAAPAPTHQRGAGQRVLPDLIPFPVHIVPREPHPYRSSGAEAWLTAACEKVARGADYQQVFADSGYEVPTSEFGGECSEFRALHDQAMGSARNALLAGKSHPDTVAWFHIKEKSDLFSLAMYAAEEVGAPRVRLGESFVEVKKDLGIGAYGQAVQVLVEAMPYR